MNKNLQSKTNKSLIEKVADNIIKIEESRIKIADISGFKIIYQEGDNQKTGNDEYYYVHVILYLRGVGEVSINTLCSINKDDLDSTMEITDDTRETSPTIEKDSKKFFSYMNETSNHLSKILVKGAWCEAPESRN